MSPFTVIEVKVLLKSFSLNETPESSSIFVLMPWKPLAV